MKINKKKNLILTCLIFILTFITDIGYSALTSNIIIGGNAQFMEYDSIRIINVEAQDMYNTDNISFTKDTFSGNIDMSSVFIVTIKNFSNEDLQLQKIEKTTFDASNWQLTATDGTDTYCRVGDIIPAGEEVQCYIYLECTSLISEMSFKLTFKMGTIVYNRIMVNNLYDYNYEEDPYSSDPIKFTYNWLNGPLKSNQISTIEYHSQSSFSEYDNQLMEYWDISENQDNSIRAYYTTDYSSSSGDTYSVIIVSEGLISAPINMSYHYTGLKQMTQLSLDSLDTSTTTAMTGTFVGTTSILFANLGLINTSKVTDMSYMFLYCNLENFNLSEFDTSSVENMAGMFSNCSAYNPLTIRIDTSKVTSMYSLFSNSRFYQLNLYLNTSKVNDMSYMFSYAKIESIDFNFDEGYFNTSNVLDMSYMFYYFGTGDYLDDSFSDCITNINLSGFNTSKVTTMSYMFSNARLASLYVDNFSTGNVTDYTSMFENVAIKDSSLSLMGFTLNENATLDNIFYNIFSGNVTSLYMTQFQMELVPYPYTPFGIIDEKTQPFTIIVGSTETRLAVIDMLGDLSSMGTVVISQIM